MSNERSEDIVSFKQFREDIGDINGDGNLEMAHNKIGWHIDHETDYDGNPITYEYLLSKYREHITAWNKQYADNKYLSKEEKAKKKTFTDFLTSKWYKRNFDHFTPKKGWILISYYAYQKAKGTM